MKESIIHSNIAIPANHQAAIISEPRESSLDFPAAFITSQLSAIMVFLLFVIAPVRANQFDTMCLELPSQRVTVISFIGNQSLMFFSRTTSTFAWHSNVTQRFFEELDLRWGLCQPQAINLRASPAANFKKTTDAAVATIAIQTACFCPNHRRMMP